MITVRRIRYDLFNLTVEIGNTKVEEQINIGDLVEIFDAVANALTDDAHRSARDQREQNTRIVQLQKELAEAKATAHG